MKMCVGITQILLAIVLIAADATISVSQKQIKSDDELRIKLDTNLVVLDAQVLSKKTGITVGGLKYAKKRTILDTDTLVRPSASKR